MKGLMIGFVVVGLTTSLANSFNNAGYLYVESMTLSLLGALIGERVENCIREMKEGTYK